MRTLYTLVISLLVLGCNKSTVIKYDFVSEKTNNDKKGHYSVVLKTNQDTIYKYYYFGLNSNYDIVGKKSNYLSKEYFSLNKQYIDGIVELKTGVVKGESWKSLYESDYIDSLTITVLDVLNDTVINGIKIRQCYVYDLKYDPLTAGEDYQDYRIFFDPDRKISIKKEYYFNEKFKGSEVLERENL